jgi:hypothetical protein
MIRAEAVRSTGMTFEIARPPRRALVVTVLLAASAAFACGDDGAEEPAATATQPGAPAALETAVPSPSPAAATSPPTATAPPAATSPAAQPTAEPRPEFSPTTVEATPVDGVAILPAGEGFLAIPPLTEQRRYDASQAGIGVPVSVDVPAGWRLFYADSLVAASPPDDFSRGLAIVMRPRGDLASAQEAFERAITEAEGAYEVLAVPPDFALPQGFDGGGLTAVTRDFELGPAPDDLLQNWLGLQGARTYWAVALAGDQVLLAVIESSHDEDFPVIEAVFGGFRIVPGD